MDDLGEGFALTAQTVTFVDPRRVSELMRTALEGLVEALESAPETGVRAIDVMPEAERRQVVEEWNATEAEYPREKLHPRTVRGAGRRGAGGHRTGLRRAASQLCGVEPASQQTWRTTYCGWVSARKCAWAYI